jgi:hypothetical protein
MRRRSFLGAVPLLPGMLRGQAEEGFTPLFDGQSLQGWMIRDGPETAFYVRDGAIVVHSGSNFPTWLQSERQYENFDFRCEFFLRGWIDSGLYFHAPEHGRNAWAGFDIKICHKQDAKPLPESAGAIFPLIPPLKVNVRNKGEWNSMRVVMDWPLLRVWMNEELVQDLDVESVPEMRHRLRKGYLGLESLSYPVRFRNLRIRELPSKERWDPLYEGPQDMDKWFIAEGKPVYEALGPVLRGDGLGYLSTKEQYRDFALQMYVRASKWSNGGIYFRAQREAGRGRHYEIQIHDVENAMYPTGSLYNVRRAAYPRIEPEQWFLLQMVVQGKYCLVRINGDTVVEYDQLDHVETGHIMLQAHQAGRWVEYKQIRIKRL